MSQDVNVQKIESGEYVIDLLRLGTVTERLKTFNWSELLGLCDLPGVMRHYVTAEYLDQASGYMLVHEVGILKYTGQGVCRQILFTDGSVMSLYRIGTPANELIELPTDLSPEFPIERLKLVSPEDMEVLAFRWIESAISKVDVRSTRIQQIFPAPSKLEELLYLIETVFESIKLMPSVILNHKEKEF